MMKKYKKMSILWIIFTYPLFAVTPDALPNLTLWLDASHGATVDGSTAPVDGDPIGSWTNKIGGPLFATASGGVRPIYKTNIFNSQPVLRFDGVDDEMLVSSFIDSTYNTNYTVFTVGKKNNSSLQVFTSSNGINYYYGLGTTMSISTVGLSDGSLSQGLSQGTRLGVGVFSYNGSQKVARFNTFQVTEAATGNLGLSGSYMIGGLTSLGFNLFGDIAEVIVYKRALSAIEIGQIEAYLASKYGINKKQIICEGDSITQGTGSTGGLNYPNQLQTLLGGNSVYDVYNLATSGASINNQVQGGPASMLSEASTTDTLSNQLSASNILVFFGGTNDLVQEQFGYTNSSGISVPPNTDPVGTIYNRIVSYAQARRAAGFKVIVPTILPRSGAFDGNALNVSRLAVNTLLRANWRTFADALADVAADSRIGDYGDQLNTTYYAESVHPNNNGYAVIADIIEDSVLNIESVPSVTSLTPLNNATDVAPTDNLILSFSEAMNIGTGTVTIKKISDNSTVESIAIDSGHVSGNNTSTITINPTVTLDYSTAYYIEISNTALTDTASNIFGGISGNSTWNFTTIAAPDTTPPSFTMQIYSDSVLSTTVADNARLTSGTYYVSVTSDETLSAAPTISISAEGTANDITNTSMTSVSGNQYKYIYVVSEDVAATGTVLADFSVTGTDSASNTATNVSPTNEATKTIYTDTVGTSAAASFAASVTGNSSTANLSWVNPVDADFASVTIRRSTSTYPTSITDGTGVAADITGTTRSDTGLTDGIYYYSIFAKDATGNVSVRAQATATIDTTAPVLSTVTAITTPMTDTTPDYTFTTNEAGTITYGGSCSSVTTSTTVGNNTITLNTLTPGTYTNCTLTVTDAATNVSNILSIPSFVIKSLDSTPPTLSAGSPTAQQSAGTTSVNLSVTTNENATCKYSTTTGTSYASMTDAFTLTGTTSHTQVLTGLANGTSYTYYVRCSDSLNNVTVSDYTISFSIQNTSSGGGGLYITPTNHTTTNNATHTSDTDGNIKNNTPILANTNIGSTFRYLSEDKHILSQLQNYYPTVNLTVETYKNTCETNQGKNYYKSCVIGLPASNFDDFLQSTTCEKFIATQFNRDDYELFRTAPRKEAVGVALKMKKSNGASPSLLSEIEAKQILQAVYSDVGQDQDSATWIAPVVATALNHGLITNNRTIFEPDRDITRAETFVMMMKSVCMTTAYNAKTSNWQRDIFNLAKSNNITVRDNFEAFAANAPILRQELITIAGRITDWAERTGGCDPKPEWCFIK